MIALLMAASLAGQPTPVVPPYRSSGWQVFTTRPNGFGDTAFLYDGDSRRQQGDVVSLWVTYHVHYSGRNSTTHVELWDINCRLMTSHRAGGFILDGREIFRSRAEARTRTGRFSPIRPASAEAALADRICH